MKWFKKKKKDSVDMTFTSGTFTFMSDDGLTVLEIVDPNPGKIICATEYPYGLGEEWNK
jgi:hypothetical protein